jgi:hypothetical protein
MKIRAFSTLKEVYKMKKYKVLTNWFRDFEHGDIVTLQKNAKRSFYQRQELSSYSLIDGLPIEFVENFPEHFEEIKSREKIPLNEFFERILSSIDSVTKEYRTDDYHSVTVESGRNLIKNEPYINIKLSV